MAGTISPRSVNRMNSATAARICGNSMTSSSDSRPSRRPLKRNREKAYAASALQNSCTNVTTAQTISVLSSQRGNGREASPNRARKFTRLKSRGISDVDTTLPSGFRAADTR